MKSTILLLISLANPECVSDTKLSALKTNTRNTKWTEPLARAYIFVHTRAYAIITRDKETAFERTWEQYSRG